MARLSVVFAAGVVLLVAVVAIAAEASTKTIITTTTLDQVDDSNQDRCRQQMQQQQMLNQCMMYLRTMQGRSPYEVSLMRNMEADQNPGRGEEQQYLQLCCNQLRNMDEDCRCEGLEMMVRQQMGQMQQQQMRRMMQMAQNIPQRCGMQQCRSMRAAASWF